MLSTPGNNLDLRLDRFQGNSAMQHLSLVDENYLVIVSHIDLSLHDKIKRGDYIDFAKLLPKDKIVTVQEEHHFELVNRGGQTFFVPAERESGVTSFQKWEQAFRIFFKYIYTRTPGPGI